MKYLSISIDVKADEVEELEAIIEGYGCLACVISSSTDESSAEEIYETAPGEVRLWLTNKLIAYFAIDQNIIGLGGQLSAFDPDISQRMSFEYVELDSSDNESSFLSVNKIIGNKLHIKPKKSKPQIKPETDLYILYLDPGLAFGSGEHPTTELCLEWLTDQQLRGKNALDYGCGSGILGIAASLLGASSVCVDYDQQALVATEQNAAFNELTKNELTVMHSSKLGLEEHRHSFDVILANILAKPLIDLSDMMIKLLAPGGKIVLSGILEEQADWVAESYKELSFGKTLVKQGWARLEAEKVEQNLRL